MKIFVRIGILLGASALAACATGSESNRTVSASSAQTVSAGTAAAPSPGRDTHERLTGALWVQGSAEYRVDSLAKYRAAMKVLDVALTDPKWTAAVEQTGDPSGLKQLAVIMDLDETVLDNSRFQGELVIERAGYLDTVWAEWVQLADAGAVPGATDFIRYAESRGVTVFFVTNRTVAEEPATRINLGKLGIVLPGNRDTVLTKNEKPGWSSDKGTRRAEIAASYRVVMLVGDDLGDFLSGAKDAPEKRVTLAEKYAANFGERWVLIANPLYGSWESALYGHDFSKTDAEILKNKFDLVKGFR